MTSGSSSRSMVNHAHVHTYMHTCMHTYIHAYIHAYIHTYINTYIHTYIHTYMHTHIHTYTHTYMHRSSRARAAPHSECPRWVHWCARTYARMHVCMHACMRACTHARMHTCVPSLAHIHACMHTYIHSGARPTPPKGPACDALGRSTRHGPELACRGSRVFRQGSARAEASLRSGRQRHSPLGRSYACMHAHIHARTCTYMHIHARITPTTLSARQLRVANR